MRWRKFTWKRRKTIKRGDLWSSRRNESSRWQGDGNTAENYLRHFAKSASPWWMAGLVLPLTIQECTSRTPDGAHQWSHTTRYAQAFVKYMFLS